MKIEHTIDDDKKQGVYIVAGGSIYAKVYGNNTTLPYSVEFKISDNPKDEFTEKELLKHIKNELVPAFMQKKQHDYQIAYRGVREHKLEDLQSYGDAPKKGETKKLPIKDKIKKAGFDELAQISIQHRLKVDITKTKSIVKARQQLIDAVERKEFEASNPKEKKK